MGFFEHLFDGSDFPPRWHCGNWSTAHGWLHIGSDLAIFGAYLTLPLLLLWVLRLRGGGRLRFPDPIQRLGWYFAGFILCCGLTHLNEAIIFYHPFYRFAGVSKLLTAMVSWATVFAVAPAIPRILQLKTMDQLEREVERARAEALAERERSDEAEYLMRLTVDASPTALLTVDTEGRIILDNPEARRLFGYENGELMARSVDDLVPKLQGQNHAELRREYLKHPAARRVAGGRILRAVRKDGSEFPAEIGLNPIHSAHGLRVLCAIMDRTETVEHQQRMTEANNELQRSNVDLESFASAASHDLRAPLRAIQNAALWLEEDIPPEALNEDAKESLRLLKSRASRMELLLTGLLEYARPGYASVRAERFSVRAVVDDVVLLLGEAAKDCVRVEGTLPEVVAPRAAFEQVLSNLVANALKHGAETKGLEVVVVSRAGDGVDWFDVSDNGPGIATEYHQRIFELFQTLRPRDEVEGAGMGLSLVKKVVERYGGEVRVDSILGRGATFSFSWPRDVERVSLPTVRGNDELG